MSWMILSLCILLSANSFAEQSLPDKNSEITKSCAALIADLTGVSPEGKELDRIRKVKNDLEDSLANDVRANYSLMGVTQMRSVQVYERTLFLLARGDTRELVPLIRPYFSKVYDNFKILRATSAELAKLRKQQPQDRKQLAELEKRFIEASKPFGEYYGGFMALHALLDSVAQGKGVDDTAGIIPRRSNDQNFVILNLKGEPAKLAAKRALEILKPSVEAAWLPHLANVNDDISREEIHTLFTHNIYAVIAKLQRDQSEQIQSHTWWKRGVQHLASFYLHLSDRSFIPERYRKWLLRLTGIAYDQMMLERYLDKVQAVVEVARNRTENGDIVLSSDLETLELQTKTMIEFRNSGVGEDFLATFARLGYHTESWMNLKLFLQKKAENTKDLTSEYVDLLAAMNEAEARKQELGGLPYTYDPAFMHQFIFVGMQLAYVAGTEEAVRNYGLPWMHHLMGLFF